MLWLATLEARCRLKSGHAPSVMVDTSLFFHAVTHETAWISTGVKQWGPHKIETGYAARIPVHADACDSDSYAEIRFLPAIFHLARLGYLHFFTSAELQAERWRQPAGRFSGYGYYDLNLLEGIPITQIDESRSGFPSDKQSQLDRVAACDDPQFLRLLAALGEKNSLDAYHIFTAEKAGIRFFIHLDIKLDKKLREPSVKAAVGNLRIEVLLPRQLAKRLHLRPMSPRLLSWEDHSFPIRPDLHNPGQKRRRPAKSS